MTDTCLRVGHLLLQGGERFLQGSRVLLAHGGEFIRPLLLGLGELCGKVLLLLVGGVGVLLLLVEPKNLNKIIIFIFILNNQTSRACIQGAYISY